MRFLVDQNLPATLAERLSGAGYEAEHTAGLGLERAADEELFVWCRAHDAVLLTADKKHTKFIASERATTPSVVIFRDYLLDVERLVSDAIALVVPIRDAIAKHGHAVFSVAPDRPARVQLLPLHGVPADVSRPLPTDP